jgi:hypothetical protein
MVQKRIYLLVFVNQKLNTIYMDVKHQELHGVGNAQVREKCGPHMIIEHKLNNMVI